MPDALMLSDGKDVHSETWETFFHLRLEANAGHCPLPFLTSTMPEPSEGALEAHRSASGSRKISVGSLRFLITAPRRIMPSRRSVVSGGINHVFRDIE